jgi:hypothetical protein
MTRSYNFQLVFVDAVWTVKAVYLSQGSAWHVEVSTFDCLTGAREVVEELTCQSEAGALVAAQARFFARLEVVSRGEG